MSPDQQFTEHYAIRMPDGKLFNYPGTDSVARWSTEYEAQRVVDQMRESQRHFGVPDWDAEVVVSYATPFIGKRDNADGLLAELERWLQQQTGGGAS